MAATPEKPLTPQQELFVEAYIANGFVAYKAYKLAFPETTDSGLTYKPSRELAKPQVKKAISDRMAEALGEQSALAQKVLIKLDQIAFAEKGDTDYNTPAQLKALELIQKQLGLQTQNVKAQIDTVVEINIIGDTDVTET